jgi:hypothetical protein
MKIEISLKAWYAQSYTQYYLIKFLFLSSYAWAVAACQRGAVSLASMPPSTEEW